MGDKYTRNMSCSEVHSLHVFLGRQTERSGAKCDAVGVSSPHASAFKMANVSNLSDTLLQRQHMPVQASEFCWCHPEREKRALGGHSTKRTISQAFGARHVLVALFYVLDCVAAAKCFREATMMMVVVAIVAPLLIAITTAYGPSDPDPHRPSAFGV